MVEILNLSRNRVQILIQQPKLTTRWSYQLQNTIFKIWAILDSFVPKSGEGGHLPKKNFEPLFYPYTPLTIYAISDKSLQPIPTTVHGQNRIFWAPEVPKGTFYQIFFSTHFSTHILP